MSVTKLSIPLFFIGLAAALIAGEITPVIAGAVIIAYIFGFVVGYLLNSK